SAATYSPACLCARIATISFSTTRCLPNASISVSASAKCPAPPSIFRKPPPSISTAACNMASECSQPLCSSPSSAPALSATPYSAKMEKLLRPLLRRTTRDDCPPLPRAVDVASASCRLSREPALSLPKGRLTLGAAGLETGLDGIELNRQTEPSRGSPERWHGFVRLCGAGGTRPPSRRRPRQLRAAHRTARETCLRKHLRPAPDSRSVAGAQ